MGEKYTIMLEEISIKFGVSFHLFFMSERENETAETAQNYGN